MSDRFLHLCTPDPEGLRANGIFITRAYLKQQAVPFLPLIQPILGIIPVKKVMEMVFACGMQCFSDHKHILVSYPARSSREQRSCMHTRCDSNQIVCVQ